jgi:membrane protease YdiL (CAAX protease family)
MTDENMTPKSWLGPWPTLFLFVLVCICIAVGGPIVRGWFAPHFALKGPRDIAAFRAVFSVVFDWLALVATLVILRLRGQRLCDIGWRKPAALWGWIAAFAVVVLYAWGSFKNPIRPGVYLIDSSAWLSDWSLFRIATALAIGITSGICEETMFRGFVMTQARDGGMPVITQILISAALFGTAHFGWGGLSGHFSAPAAIGAMVGSTMFGLFFAIIYVLGRRSLSPAITGHALFNFIMEPWMILFAIGGGFGG